MDMDCDMTTMILDFSWDLFNSPITRCHIIHQFGGVSHHFYADDVQLYVFETRPLVIAQNCLNEINVLMSLSFRHKNHRCSGLCTK